MSEPWLSDLSEDWKTPSSATSSSLPNRKQYSTSSRIPRPGARKSTSSIGSPLSAGTKPPAAKQRILSERSRSDINISSPKYPRPSAPSTFSANKLSSARSALRPSTLSPSGSVVKRLPSPNRKTSTTPSKTIPDPSVPGWKQHMQNPKDGQIRRADLFAPNTLEDMFQKPPSSTSNESKLTSNLDDSILRDVSAMPSSPPPWPRRDPNAQVLHESSFSGRNSSSLDAVHEEQQEAVQLDDVHVQPHQLLEQEEEVLLQDEQISNSQNQQPSHSEAPDALLQSDDSSINNKGLSLPRKAHTNKNLEPRERKVSNIRAERDESGLAPARGGSSMVSGGFSPVYISKHNTANGGIDYAAVDLSNPTTVQKLRESQTLHNVDVEEEICRDSRADGKVPNSLRNSIASRATTESQWKSTSLAPISEFVNVERGAAYEVGSFLYRPLSPSASSSILPSDSASQVYEQASRKASSADSVKTAVHCSQAQHTIPNAYQPCLPPDERQEVLDELDEGLSLIEPSAERLGMRHDDFNPLEERQMTGVPSQTDEEKHKRMQAIIGKRKDARYDGQQETCDPDELAKREILRPRNPTPSQQRLRSFGFDLKPFIENSPALELVQKHIEEANVDISNATEIEVKALAADVATMHLQEIEDEHGNIRKPSVSTQDYLNDAMKIMEIIRSKRKPQTDLSGLEESGSEHTEQRSQTKATALHRDITPQSISRPPSREGMVSAWRTESSFPVNAFAASYLERYQENGDESFLATSALNELNESKISVDARSENIATDEQSVGIRISSHPQQFDLEYGEIDPPGAKVSIITNQGNMLSPIKTQTSNRSTDSSRQTNETVSTQKTTTLAVIGPDKVSHLLHSQEAGMRFDPERKTWVKCKAVNPQDNILEEIKYSDETEDDPFQSIPDLSINDDRGTHDASTTYSNNTLEESGVSNISNFDILEIQDGTIDAEDPASEELFEGGVEEDINPRIESEVYDSDGSFYSNSYPPIAGPISLPRRANPMFPANPTQRREVSVLFSSPPVTKRYEAQNWSNSNAESDTPGFEKQPYLHKSERASGQSFRALVGSSPKSSSRNLGSGLNRLDPDLSLSRIDEHQEVSFIGTRADGRTLSLTLSLSTPLPAHRQASRPILHTGNRRSSSLWNSLSPLSNFTENQDDAKHFRARQLSLQDNRLIPSNQNTRSAVVIDNLVQKLTDVEPDEPYWDWMRALHLPQKDLSSLHTLDEFCPRIEELDVSRNRLVDLTGAPVNVRQLTARNNQLCPSARWDHLANLQYLDISSNSIESLDGFAGLVHLREVKADDNLICNLEGILDLDGLLHLSLKRNRLRSLDFQGSNLKRLSKIDVEGNQIQQVVGLHFLPELEALNLNQNYLTVFPDSEAQTSSSFRLSSVSLANNHLKSLNVKHFPSLQFINADENMLVSIDNIGNLKSLHTLSIRSQSIPSSNSPVSIIDQLDEFSEVQHLFMSGNPVSELRPKEVFLNLRTLELAFTGLHSVSVDFGAHAPNLRTLNLNSNVLTDLRPIRGIHRLEKLFVASNRLSRLRKIARVISSLPSLLEIDLRDNPLTLGFYPSVFTCVPGQSQEIVQIGLAPQIDPNIQEKHLKHMLPNASTSDIDVLAEKRHLERLDEDTLLRRRLYELLMAAKSFNLEHIDGREFHKERVFSKDPAWDRLLKLGIVEKANRGL